MNNQQISFLTDYSLVGAVSYITMLKYFNSSNTDMKCCGPAKLSDNLHTLSESSKNVLCVTGLFLEKVDLLFAVKHWHRVIIFDNSKDTKKYKTLVAKLKGKLTIISAEGCSASTTFDWCNKHSELSIFSCPNFNKLINLTKIYDLWEVDHGDWDDAFNLNDLFWKKNLWKFTDRFANGYDSLKSSEKSTLKKLKAEKIKIIEAAPKSQCSSNSAVIFLKESSPATLCPFIFSEIDYFYIIYPTFGTSSLNLSVYARRGDGYMTEPPKCDVYDAIGEMIKHYPTVFESRTGDEYRGVLSVYDNVEVNEIVKSCDKLDSLLNPERA